MSAKESLYSKTLPKDKQYLKITFRSYRREEDYLNSNSTKEKVIEGDWVDTDLENKSGKEIKKPVAIDLDADEEKEKKGNTRCWWG